MQTRKGATTLFLGLYLCSCASVTVERVDPVTRSPDVKGFRYYLPRPYVAVEKPFIVAGGDYFVTGVVDTNNRVVRLTGDGLPTDVRRHFGWPDTGPVEVDPASFVVSPEKILEDDGVPPDSGLAQNTADGGASTKATPLAFEPSLKTSRVTPLTLAPDGQSFAVNVVLAKTASFSAITSAKVGLIPIDEAKDAPKPDGFFELKTQGPVAGAFAPGTTDGQYPATGTRAELKGGRFYGVGLSVEGTYAPAGATPQTGKFLLYGSSLKLTVLGDVATSGGGDKSGDKKGEEDETQGSQPGQTKASVVTSGDPATNPLAKINDYFDVLYLPDFDEQYAVRAKSGLGKADMKMGLENGWMVETAQVAVDNTELGKFIYSNVQKLIDVGVKAAEVAAFPPAAALPSDSKLAENAASDGASLVLRIRYALEAEPGLYPVLKPEEARTQANTLKRIKPEGSPQYVMIAYPPYTVVSYNVRKTIAVELVDAKPATAGAGTGGTGGVIADKIKPDTPTIGPAITAAFQQWITSKGWDLQNAKLWTEASSPAKGQWVLVLQPLGTNYPNEQDVRTALVAGATWTLVVGPRSETVQVKASL